MLSDHFSRCSKQKQMVKNSYQQKKVGQYCSKDEKSLNRNSVVFPVLIYRNKRSAKKIIIKKLGKFLKKCITRARSILDNIVRIDTFLNSKELQEVKVELKKVQKQQKKD